MHTMKKALAFLLTLTLLLTFTACGNEEQGDTADTTTTDATTTTTTTTLPSDGDELLPDDERNGSEELPFEIGGVLEFDAVVKAGGVTHYDVYRVDGTILTIESKDATVTYKGKTYEPENGVISFSVTTDDVLNPVKLAIANKGAADATFKVTFTYPKGTQSNPYDLPVGGDVVTEIAEGNENGVVYLFVATADGTLSIHDKAVTKGQEYDIELYNLNSGANRTLLEDGVDRVVSIAVSKGDEVRVTYSVLPNDKNVYPSVTLKSTVGFTVGKVEEDTKKEITYTVTVKDKDGKAMSGVKLQFAAASKNFSTTTDKDGAAKVALEDAKASVTITLPEGYDAPQFTYMVTADAPNLTITLTKKPVATTTTTTKPADPEKPVTVDYVVTLLSGEGNPQKNVTVTLYDGEKQVAQKTSNDKGQISATLNPGTYTVKLSGTELKYDATAAVVTAGNPTLTLVLAGDIDTAKSMKIGDPLTDKDVTVYYIPEGGTYVTLKAGERNYFLFEPTRGGTYRFDISNSSAKLGYYGTDMFVFTTNIADVNGNAFTLSVQDTEVGNVFVIGVDAATNVTSAVVRATRVGDPAWSIENEPLVEYTGSAPAKVTAPGGLVDVDIKSSTEYHLVYNEQDGYYHLNSASGPVVYVRMDSKYASIVGMLNEFGNMTAYIYNADGTFKAKEQYAILMQQYVDNMDWSQKVYPLTKDLEYMIRNFGNSQNWWNEGHAGYLFEEVAGVNPANAWLFLYCYQA